LSYGRKYRFYNTNERNKKGWLLITSLIERNF